MSKKEAFTVVSSLSLFLLLFVLNLFSLRANGDDWRIIGGGPLFPKDKRETIVSTEYGDISSARVSEGGGRGCYHLQFFTLEPNSLFLPVLLHTDMIFYVHTGSGKLNWMNEEEANKATLTDLRRGDVFRLKPGTVFYLQSNLEAEREKLRIHAIFVNSGDGDRNEGPSIGAYSSISDLVRGFDRKVLEAAFQIPEELMEALTNATKPPAIVHDVAATTKNPWVWETRFLKAFVGGGQDYDLDNKKKKHDKKTPKTFNIRDATPDVKNCNGQSLTVTNRNMKILKGSDIGIFMVNLTKGSMMGPHWNPMATEIAVVLEGEGMVRVVCGSSGSNSSSGSSGGRSYSKFQCENKRFKVEEGDVFIVPRFHPMAQMSFNNGSFVFMGFSTASELNQPQFLAGQSSVLRTLDRNVLAAAFNVSNTTMDQFVTPQSESIILDCTSCAEEEADIMEKEIEKRREEEEARKREEEEARKRKEEEAKRREEEEEAKRREEEEARERKEEEAAARQRQEEEEAAARKREEEAARREEEAAASQKREEEEEGAKEEDRRREEAAKREQEEAMRAEEERQKQEREGEEQFGKKEKGRREEEETREEEEEDRRREAAAEREQEEAMRREQERQEREKEEEEIKYEIGGGEEGKRAEY